MSQKRGPRFLMRFAVFTFVAIYKVPPFLTEPGEVYRAKRKQYLSSHQLADFRHCPLMYRKKLGGLVAEWPSESFAIGSAVHTLTLEGRQEFESQYVVGGPINPTTDRPYGADTQQFTKWAKEQGKPCLTDWQFSLVTQLALAVHKHDEAKEILREGTAEGVLRGTYCQVECQVRIDWFTGRAGIADLKSCDDLDRFAPTDSRGFLLPESDVLRFHYIDQMAFYWAVCSLFTQELVPVHLIAVEKREPHRVGVFELPLPELSFAESENAAAIDELRLCRVTDSWPTKFETTRILRRA